MADQQQVFSGIQQVLQQALQAATPPPQEMTAAKARRGRPPQLSLPHLWHGLLLALLSGCESWAALWRLFCWEGVPGFPVLTLTEAAVRQRLLRAGIAPLQAFLAQISTALRAWLPAEVGQDLAPFATEIVALDESTLDAVRRLSEDVRSEPVGSARLLAGKLAGLFDLRRQQWLRLQFRNDVWANCKTGVLLLLEGLPAGSLILADLGYFSFPWFDCLTQQGYWWLSRLREKTSTQEVHVFVRRGQTLDALIWLGKYRSDRAGHLVRLIQFEHQGQLYRYLTNVLDPHQLSMQDAARLYARRWDIELAFRLLKDYLHLQLWWAAHPTLVLQQVGMALILAQILHALHLRLATEAGGDLWDVSIPVLVRLLARPPRLRPGHSLLSLLLERGRHLRLIRPSRRFVAMVPDLTALYEPAPADLPLVRTARYAHRVPHQRPKHPAFLPRFPFLLLL